MAFALHAPPRTRNRYTAMAEIRVEPKRRSATWLWVVLILLIVAAAAYFLLNRGAVPPQAQTSVIESIRGAVASLAVSAGGLAA